jgi:hypothetical protein
LCACRAPPPMPSPTACSAAPPPPSARAAGHLRPWPVVTPTPTRPSTTPSCSLFRAPHSYTGEDSVEIQCHGGSQAARRILDALVFRRRPPGRTRRIHQTRLFERQNRPDPGRSRPRTSSTPAPNAPRASPPPSSKMPSACASAPSTTTSSPSCADIEAMLDFPDDELPQSVPEDVLARFSRFAEQIQALLDTWHEGHVLREGARIVIAGAPNTGKSTLLNLLAGRDRAIVSPHPGTTRDTIEEFITLQRLSPPADRYRRPARRPLRNRTGRHPPHPPGPLPGRSLHLPRRCLPGTFPRGTNLPRRPRAGKIHRSWQ